MASDLQGLQRFGPGPGVPRPQAPMRRASDSLISITTRPVSAAALATVELPMLAVIFIVFAISVMVAPDSTLRWFNIDLPIPSTSAFFQITGIPCLFCGFTRSFMSMGGLDIRQALVFHPLGPLLFTSMLAFGAVLGWFAARRRRIVIELAPGLSRNLMRAVALVLVVAWPLKMLVWHHVGLL